MHFQRGSNKQFFTFKKLFRTRMFMNSTFIQYKCWHQFMDLCKDKGYISLHFILLLKTASILWWWLEGKYVKETGTNYPTFICKWMGFCDSLAFITSFTLHWHKPYASVYGSTFTLFTFFKFKSNSTKTTFQPIFFL